MTDQALRHGLDLLVNRVGSTLQQVGSHYPYIADPDTGAWQTEVEPQWCAGDWIHMLWMAYSRTGHQRFRDRARRLAEPWRTAPIRKSIFEGMIRYRIGAWFQELADQDWQKDLSLGAARFLLSNFDPQAGQIPVGAEANVKAVGEETEFNHDDHVHSDTTAAIDTIYVALLPLWEAAERTGDEAFAAAARSHVEQTIDWFIGPDGGTVQLIRFDPATGDPLWGFNLQGYHRIHGCWSRGQAWCIAGLSLAYEYTGEERYADALDRVLAFHLSHAPDHGIPYYDYFAPEIPDAELDTSAAAIIVSGLLRQVQGKGDVRRKNEYVNHGRKLAASLIEHSLTGENDPVDQPGRLLNGCFFQPIGSATRHELLWGSYHLMEALHRYLNARP